MAASSPGPEHQPRVIDLGLSLVATLDLEALQERILAAMAARTDSQGAAAWIADEKGELVLRCLRGLVDRDALPSRLAPGSGDLGAALLRGEPFDPDGFPRGEAFLVPLVADGEPQGMVLLERSARGTFGPEQRAAAAELARFAGVAVRNARRFRGLEQVGLRHGESGTYHLGYLLEHAGKELHKARRYGRSFSLAVLALDGLDDLRRSGGSEASQAAARALVSAVSRVVRDSDILAAVSDGEHHVLLPETDHFGALMFQRRASQEIRQELALRALGAGTGTRLSMGAATFPRDGGDLDSLLQTCRTRQEERRTSMLSRPETAGLDSEAVSFWDLFDALLGRAPIPAASPSARLALDPELLDAIQREAVREVAREPRARSVLYVARPGDIAGAVASALPRLELGAWQGDIGPRVYVLGPRVGDAGRENGLASLPEGTARVGGAGRGGCLGDRGHPLVARVSAEDRRFEAHAFLLFLSESAAYAVLQGPDGRVFHTSDAPLVDTLVAKLQAQHDLLPP
jgi:GGDEF domain-containing protein